MTTGKVRLNVGTSATDTEHQAMYREQSITHSSRHDFSAESQDAAAISETDALEALASDSSRINDFIAESGADVESLLAVLFTDGLPSGSGTENDDNLSLRLTDKVDLLREQFNAWAKRDNRYTHISPLEHYMGTAREDLH